MRRRDGNQHVQEKLEEAQKDKQMNHNPRAATISQKKFKKSVKLKETSKKSPWHRSTASRKKSTILYQHKHFPQLSELNNSPGQGIDCNKKPGKLLTSGPGPGCRDHWRHKQMDEVSVTKFSNHVAALRNQLLAIGFLSPILKPGQNLTILSDNIPLFTFFICYRKRVSHTVLIGMIGSLESTFLRSWWGMIY